MTEELNLVLEKLNEIKSELDYIKKHITDQDVLLDEDDLEAIRAGEKQRKEGTLKSLLQLKKELDF